MDRIARVTRGAGQGDYRPEPTSYGQTFWRGPGPIPVTDASMKRWLASGKATLLTATPPAPAPTDIVRAPPRMQFQRQPVALDDLDAGERSWLEEIGQWNREQRRAFLRQHGIDPTLMPKHQLLAELLSLRRALLGRRASSPVAPRQAPEDVRSNAEPQQSHHGQPGAVLETVAILVTHYGDVLFQGTLTGGPT